MPKSTAVLSKIKNVANNSKHLKNILKLSIWNVGPTYFRSTSAINVPPYVSTLNKKKTKNNLLCMMYYIQECNHYNEIVINLHNKE